MYKEKLRELLKEVPEVKEQMEKLEFGSILIIDNKEYTILKILNKQSVLLFDEEKNNSFTIDINAELSEGTKIEIIGLPLQDRFIRMYCRNKMFGCYLNFDMLNINCYGKTKWMIIDNTKDLENQSEDFYKELYTALLELNGN